MKVKKLDLGCGVNKVEGADGLDFLDLPTVKYNHDLNTFPYPIKTSTYDEIYCIHILEHVDDLIKVMDEIHRIGKKDAKVYIRGPHASCSKTLWADPTHKRGFSVRTFMDYFSSEMQWSYYTKAKFSVSKIRINYIFTGANSRIPKAFSSLMTYIANINLFSQELCERIWANWVGGFEEIEVELVIDK